MIRQPLLWLKLSLLLHAACVCVCVCTSLIAQWLCQCPPLSCSVTPASLRARKFPWMRNKKNKNSSLTWFLSLCKCKYSNTQHHLVVEEYGAPQKSWPSYWANIHTQTQNRHTHAQIRTPDACASTRSFFVSPHLQAVHVFRLHARAVQKKHLLKITDPKLAFGAASHCYRKLPAIRSSATANKVSGHRTI